jgi:hypothetical protein
VLAEAVVDVFAAQPDGGWERHVSTHLQRHHPEPAIRAALGAAGLECIAVHGQTASAELERGVDETRHTKAIYLARRETDEGR